MFSNYAGLQILNFPLNIIVLISISYGFINLCNYIVSDKKIFFKSNINYFFPIFFFILFLSLINITLLFSYNFTIFLIFSFGAICLLFLFKFRITKINKINKKNYFQIIIISFLVIYFFLSLLPISDSDSLSYHSAYGANIIKNQGLGWLRDIHLVHPDFLVSGLGEIINFVGLVFMIDNFGSFFNFMTLIFVVKIFYILNAKKKINYFIILTTISSPILLPVIFSQKIYLLPSLILAFLMFLIVEKKKLNDFDFLMIYSMLIFCVSVKISFLIPVTLLILFFLYKSLIKKKLKNHLLFLILSFFFIFFPVLAKNIIYHGDVLPPFSGYILGTNDLYLNTAVKFFQNYDLKLSFETLLLLPILFLVPHIGNGYGQVFLSLPNIGKIYGFQFYNFFFASNLNKFFYILFLFSILSVLITGNVSTRWFLFIFLFCQLCILNKEIKPNKVFKYLLILQTFFFFSAIIFYSIYNLSSIFNISSKELFLKNNANGYDFYKKIESLKKIKKIKNEYILYSQRSNFWTDINSYHLNLGNEWLKFYKIRQNKLTVTNKFKPTLNNKKIKIIILSSGVLNKQVAKNTFKLDCDYEFGNLTAKYSTRNIFFRGSKEFNWIFFKNSDFLNCLKSY